MESIENRASFAAETLSDVKLEDIVVLDLRGISDFTDFFIIATVGAPAQGNAAVQRVLRGMREHGIRPFSSPETDSSAWTVVDYGDLVIHLFDKETRAHYGLETLWGDAKEFDWEAGAA